MVTIKEEKTRPVLATPIRVYPHGTRFSYERFSERCEGELHISYGSFSEPKVLKFVYPVGDPACLAVNARHPHWETLSPEEESYWLEKLQAG